jgi:hypothetical protein
MDRLNLSSLLNLELFFSGIISSQYTERYTEIRKRGLLPFSDEDRRSKALLNDNSVQ